MIKFWRQSTSLVNQFSFGKTMCTLKDLLFHLHEAHYFKLHYSHLLSFLLSIRFVLCCKCVTYLFFVFTFNVVTVDSMRYIL